MKHYTVLTTVFKKVRHGIRRWMSSGGELELLLKRTKGIGRAIPLTSALYLDLAAQ